MEIEALKGFVRIMGNTVRFIYWEQVNMRLLQRKFPVLSGIKGLSTINIVKSVVYGSFFIDNPIRATKTFAEYHGIDLQF